MLPVDVLSTQAAVLKRHLLLGNIIAETPAPEPQAILSGTMLHAGKFFDRMAAAPVVGIGRENTEYRVTKLVELPMMLDERGYLRA